MVTQPANPFGLSLSKAARTSVALRAVLF